MFLAFIVIGLVGILLMALPAFSQHGGLGHGHGVGHALGHTAHAPHALSAHGVGTALADKSLVPAEVGHTGRLGQLIPSPRTIFSMAALYGAFGNALVHAAHLPTGTAAALAVVPALLVERVLLRPLWTFVFRHQAPPSTAFAALVLAEARALTTFTNGRGLIETTRDGRRIQLLAHLREDQRAVAVEVGTQLVIEDVDATTEGVTVVVR